MPHQTVTICPIRQCAPSDSVPHQTVCPIRQCAPSDSVPHQTVRPIRQCAPSDSVPHQTVCLIRLCPIRQCAHQTVCTTRQCASSDSVPHQTIPPEDNVLHKLKDNIFCQNEVEFLFVCINLKKTQTSTWYPCSSATCTVSMVTWHMS